MWTKRFSSFRSISFYVIFTSGSPSLTSTHTLDRSLGLWGSFSGSAFLWCRWYRYGSGRVRALETVRVTMYNKTTVLKVARDKAGIAIILYINNSSTFVVHWLRGRHVPLLRASGLSLGGRIVSFPSMGRLWCSRSGGL